jgi:pimeloyl-ACP methyl ester carboxylesterase
VTVSTPTSTTRDFELRDGLTITVEEQGDAAASAGTGVLLLHGGAGPRSMTGLAVALSQDAYVITPTHPGFDGRPRPDWVDSIADLAVAYLDLLDALDLHKVLVIGSSVGGWIAAEMALRDTRGRIGGLTLLNAVGIKPEAPLEIAELAKVGPVEFGRMAFHNPELRPNPAALSEEQRAAIAANQRTLAVYSGDPYAHDPKLIRRLHRVTVPVLVAWGEHDGVAPLEYGRAFANAFPRARFEPISAAAHFPHIEQAGQTLGVIEDFVNSEIKPDGE